MRIRTVSMSFDPRGAANRLHSLANAVSASPADVAVIHDTLVSSALEAPRGMSDEQTAAAYAHLVHQLPQFLEAHADVRNALNTLQGQISAASETRPGDAASLAVDWDLVKFLLICIVLC
jgi:hypothetical protein